jgi:hypothetical protein
LKAGVALFAVVSVALFAALFSLPKRTERAVLTVRKVLAFLVRAAHVPLAHRHLLDAVLKKEIRHFLLDLRVGLLGAGLPLSAPKGQEDDSTDDYATYGRIRGYIRQSQDEAGPKSDVPILSWLPPKDQGYCHPSNDLDSGQTDSEAQGPMTGPEEAKARQCPSNQSDHWSPETNLVRYQGCSPNLPNLFGPACFLQHLHLDCSDKLLIQLDSHLCQSLNDALERCVHQRRIGKRVV